MRNTLGKLCVIFATLLLLLFAAFFTISLILKDNDLIGTLFKEPEIREQVEASTGIDRPAELENATAVLFEYMRGERVNIKVGATVNGAYRDDLFTLEKEVVHMAEVQTLWLGLDAFAKFGAIGALEPVARWIRRVFPTVRRPWSSFSSRFWRRKMYSCSFTFC